MSKPLSKLEILLIRACKDKDPEKRLTSIHRRFYLISGTSDRDLLRILMGVCNKIGHPDSFELVDRLNPLFRWYDKGKGYTGNALSIYISHIRCMSVKGLNGFVSPLWCK